MLVVGDREAAEGTVSVRSRSGGDQGAEPVDAISSRRRATKSRRKGSVSGQRSSCHDR